MADIPQPKRIAFDFHGRCKAYEMPDGTIAIIGADLQLHLISRKQWDRRPEASHWVSTLHKDSKR